MTVLRHVGQASNKWVLSVSPALLQRLIHILVCSTGMRTAGPSHSPILQAIAVAVHGLVPVGGMDRRAEERSTFIVMGGMPQH